LQFEPEEAQSTPVALGDDTQPTLSLTLLGPMRARDAHGADVLPRLRKARALLAVLALAAPSPVLRSRLIELLWSTRTLPKAQASVRATLHALSITLGPTARMLDVARRTIALDAAGLLVDARQLVSAATNTSDDSAASLGGLLSDLEGLEPAFDRWIIEQRHGLAHELRMAAELNIAHAGSPLEARAAAERLLAFDPAHEGAWRALIDACIRCGDRAAAIDAFERCRRTLLKRYRVEPSPETMALVSDLRPAPMLSGQTSPHVRAPYQGARIGSSGGRVRLGLAAVGGDRADNTDELSDALTNELMEALSRFRGLDCVRCTGIDADDDIEFLLTGFVRRHANRCRLSLRLTDHRAGGIVVWAERYDQEIGSASPSLAHVASSAVAQIEARLWLWRANHIGQGDTAGRTPAELVHVAAPMVHRLDRQGFMLAGRWLKQAVELDPDHASAYAWFVQWSIFYVGQGWATDAGVALQRAQYFAQKCVELDPEDARGLTLAGHALAFLDHRPDEALRLHERAIETNPNLPLSWCLSGLAESYVGNSADAIQHIHHSLALSPADPLDYFNENALCAAYTLNGDYEAAAAAGVRSIMLNPGFSSSRKSYLAAMGHLGRREAAAPSLRALLKLEPGFTVNQAVSRSPIATKEGLAIYAEGLRAAGLS
jgi:DNA-binding SARP family transcriptional activator/TolB-like protein